LENSSARSMSGNRLDATKRMGNNIDASRRTKPRGTLFASASECVAFRQLASAVLRAEWFCLCRRQHPSARHRHLVVRRPLRVGETDIDKIAIGRVGDRATGLRHLDCGRRDGGALDPNRLAGNRHGAAQVNAAFLNEAGQRRVEGLFACRQRLRPWPCSCHPKWELDKVRCSLGNRRVANSGEI
jgi:hypothetical protein